MSQPTYNPDDPRDGQDLLDAAIAAELALYAAEKGIGNLAEARAREQAAWDALRDQADQDDDTNSATERR
jgi:hypothetical protein